MNALGRWVGVVGLWWALAGGAATILAADGGSPAPGSTASGVFLSSDPVVAAGSTIGDSLVQPTSASSVVEDTSDLLDTNLPGRSCCDEPAWIVSGGAVFLHRSRPDPTAIATPSSGQGTLISGSNLGFNWNSGPLVSIGRRTASGLIIEGRYFNDRDATASYNLDNITTFRTAGIGVTILGGGSLSSTYQTQLDSTELNVLKPLNDRLSLIGGFRAVQLHDQLNVNITSPSIYTNWNEKQPAIRRTDGHQPEPVRTGPGSAIQRSAQGRRLRQRGHESVHFEDRGRHDEQCGSHGLRGRTELYGLVCDHQAVIHPRRLHGAVGRRPGAGRPSRRQHQASGRRHVQPGQPARRPMVQRRRSPAWTTCGRADIARTRHPRPVDATGETYRAARALTAHGASSNRPGTLR